MSECLNLALSCKIAFLFIMFQTKVDKILEYLEGEEDRRRKLDIVYTYICSLNDEEQRKNGVAINYVDAPGIHKDVLPMDTFSELKAFDRSLINVPSKLSNYVSIYYVSMNSIESYFLRSVKIHDFLRSVKIHDSFIL